MKITDITTDLVSVPLVKEAGAEASFGIKRGTTRLIIQVHTDEGHVGLGEAWPYTRQDHLVIMERYRERLIGRSPFDHEWIWKLMDKPRGWMWNPGFLALMSGIEIALWDLMGKAVGKPVYELLGGKFRSKHPVTGTLYFLEKTSTVEDVVAQAKEQIAAHGYTTFKLKGGVRPFQEEARCLRRLREELGPYVNLRTDPNGVWSVEETIRFCAMVEDLDLEWLEDPCAGLDAFARVREKTKVLLCTNQYVMNEREFAAALPLRAVDVIRGDFGWWGGLWRTKKLAAACEYTGLGFAMHPPWDLGIYTAALLHLAASTPNLTYATDYFGTWISGDVIKGGYIPVKDGFCHVPDGPGLGVELDPDAMAEYKAIARSKWYDMEVDPRAMPG
ncbi:mandelate racemase/muconate lactonizing enzyme family protein [Bosea thiooxidans]